MNLVSWLQGSYFNFLASVAWEGTEKDVGRNAEACRHIQHHMLDAKAKQVCQDKSACRSSKQTPETDNRIHWAAHLCQWYKMHGKERIYKEDFFGTAKQFDHVSWVTEQSASPITSGRRKGNQQDHPDSLIWISCCGDGRVHTGLLSSVCLGKCKRC